VRRKVIAHWQRRSLAFDSLDDFRREIVRLDDARNEGTLNRSGNWSLDQCCQHLGRWVEFSIDGFPFKYPWRFRLMGRLVRLVSWRLLVSLALRPGFMNQPTARAVQPDAMIADGEGVNYLRRQLARLEHGERMKQTSPVEGAISHEQWCYFHLRHAELHLGFQIVGANGKPGQK
jgi:Protein of unknown function (DUF1569)